MKLFEILDPFEEPEGGEDITPERQYRALRLMWQHLSKKLDVYEKQGLLVTDYTEIDRGDFDLYIDMEYPYVGPDGKNDTEVWLILNDTPEEVVKKIDLACRKCVDAYTKMNVFKLQHRDIM